MSQSQWQQSSEHQFALVGDLNRDSVPMLWRTLQSSQWAVEQAEISLAELKRIDSAGMVMLIHLLEHAKKQNCHIMLSFVPDELHTLFQLSNVDELVAGHLKNTTGVNCG